MGLIALGVVESAGDASLCEARFVDGLSDDEVMHLFRSAVLFLKTFTNIISGSGNELAPAILAARESQTAQLLIQSFTCDDTFQWSSNFTGPKRLPAPAAFPSASPGLLPGFQPPFTEPGPGGREASCGKGAIIFSGSLVSSLVFPTAAGVSMISGLDRSLGSFIFGVFSLGRVGGRETTLGFLYLLQTRYFDEL